MKKILFIFIVGLVNLSQAQDFSIPSREIILKPATGNEPRKIEVVTNALQTITDIREFTKGNLNVPKDVYIPYSTNTTNYSVIFGVTNNTLEKISIVGHTTSCGCTQVSATQQDVPPKGQILIQAQISKTHPTTEYILLRDSQNNLYQTLIWITQKKNSTP